MATNQSIVVEWLLEKRPLTGLNVDAPSEVGVHIRMVVCSVHDNSVWLLVFICEYMYQLAHTHTHTYTHTHTHTHARVRARHSLPQNGYTALMIATEYSHNEMCEILLRNGAKVDCAAAVSHIVGVPLLCRPLKGD